MKKIKIVFLHYQLVCGGAEQALFDLVSLLDKEKFDVTVLTMIDGGAWDSKFRDAGINVIHLFQKRKNRNNPVHFVMHQLKKMWTYYFLHFKPEDLIPKLFPEGIDIIVSYSIWMYDRIGFAKGAKSVKFIHGNIQTNASYCKDIMKISKILPDFHRIVCVSHEASQAFRQITGLNQNVETHFNPLNSNNVKKLAECPVDIPKDIPVICAVGRLAPEKGYGRLIRIHKKILDQGIAHKIIIVGDGPEKENLNQIIKETSTEDSVFLLGYQSNPYPYMKNSDFLVCSSLTEGLPVIAMEALSLGIPIVSTIPSIAEIFGDENCGIITENDDNSLENGIKKMLTDRCFFDEVKQNAKIQSRFFDGRLMTQEIEKMFISVVTDKP